MLASHAAAFYFIFFPPICLLPSAASPITHSPLGVAHLLQTYGARRIPASQWAPLDIWRISMRLVRRRACQIFTLHAVVTFTRKPAVVVFLACVPFSSCRAAGGGSALLLFECRRRRRFIRYISRIFWIGRWAEFFLTGHDWTELLACGLSDVHIVRHLIGIFAQKSQSKMAAKTTLAGSLVGSLLDHFLHNTPLFCFFFGRSQMLVLVNV